MVQLTRIHPDRRSLGAEEALSGLALGDRAPVGRPYLVLNMVVSADGKVTVEGRSRALSGEADRRLFHELRTQVDAVMVGAGTLRAERYGRLVRDPALREKRRREGLAPDPLACVVSARLDLPEDLPLLGDPDSDVLIATSSAGTVAAGAAGAGPGARVEYLRSAPAGRAGASVPLDVLLERLRADYGVRSVLCEGGPTLNARLLGLGLVDELFLSLAPALVGGAGALTLAADPALPKPEQLELVWVLESEGYLFLRYRLR